MTPQQFGLTALFFVSCGALYAVAPVERSVAAVGQVGHKAILPTIPTVQKKGAYPDDDDDNGEDDRPRTPCPEAGITWGRRSDKVSRPLFGGPFLSH